MHDVRKSCDQCNRAKRKCDGERPCSRCIDKEIECSYSKRRPRNCTTYRTRRLRALESTEGTPGNRGPADTALKRCRLSASPATGLVGMQENLFLSDFFGCVGFLPLATQSDVRDAMVKIMLSSASTAARQNCGEGDNSGTIVTGFGFDRAFEGDGLPTGPSSCTFWCAIAIGALVKGRSIESVAKYFQLAREALASQTAPSNVEVAKAWAIMAYLYGIAGDLPTFHEYLALSDGLISEITQRGADDVLPVGFPEVVRHGETIKLFTGTADPEELESFLSQKMPRPEISDLATEGELCRYIMQSYREFEQSVHKEARLAKLWNTKNEAVHDEARSDDAPPAGSIVDGQPDGNPFTRPVGHMPRGHQCLGLLVRMKMQLRERMGFGRLETAVERPGLRGGVGAMVINGTLIFEKAAKGDTTGALDRLGRCVEVFERYPGLHRFAMGAHMGHIMIQMAAHIDDPRARDFYQRLRCAFNITRDPGLLPFPPLEEWQGMAAYCDNVPCRSIPKLFPGRQLELFGSQPLWEGDTTAEQEESRDSDSPAQLWPGASVCAHEALDELLETPEFVDWTTAESGGAMASPSLARSLGEEFQDNDVAAEDWLEATHALDVALGE